MTADTRISHSLAGRDRSGAGRSLPSVPQMSIERMIGATRSRKRNRPLVRGLSSVCHLATRSLLRRRSRRLGRFKPSGERPNQIVTGTASLATKSANDLESSFELFCVHLWVLRYQLVFVD